VSPGSQRYEEALAVLLPEAFLISMLPELPERKLNIELQARTGWQQDSDENDSASADRDDDSSWLYRHIWNCHCSIAPFATIEQAAAMQLNAASWNMAGHLRD